MADYRNRIGKDGIKLIFQESIRVNNRYDEGQHQDTAFIDFTVPEKNVAFPTDAKVYVFTKSKIR